MALSSSARSVWAKSPDEEGAWLPLWQHMDDSAMIAGGLFDRWLAPSVVGMLAAEFGGDRAAARCAVCFLAGVHDLGKAIPAFAIQHGGLAQRMREHGLYMPNTRYELPERAEAHHTVAGHHLLIRWLSQHGWGRKNALAWGVVLGGHHGVPPEQDVPALPASYPKLFGEGQWVQVQRELADRVAEQTGVLEYLDQWRDHALSIRFQVIVTGIVIMADWIASNQDLLPYLTGPLPEAVREDRRAAVALDRLALPVPWSPNDIPDDVDILLRSRFTLPDGAAPRPVQIAACEIARRMPEPGLLVIEAPMGEGKTEAALAAAEILADRWGAGGLMIALPTQATSDAMFGRVVDWLDALGAGGQQVGGAITLGHGKARFNRVFQGFVRAGRFGSAEIGCDDEKVEGARGRRRAPNSVIAHSWMVGRKKGQLANFSIGTIDQLLFAGLKARHLMLRHLALAGKVVVIDEVHAYDAYMNSYLTKVLTWLGAYGVPVVALSATLPADRRQALMDAYRRGVDRDADRVVLSTVGYPIVSWTEPDTVHARVVEPSGRSINVRVEALGGAVDNDLPELTSLLRDALSEGGCAVVVRNTVRRVLETAAALEAEFPGAVTVAHARFTAADRARNDLGLLDRFGAPARATTRPDKHIVVASQVVEQSLDVDFDLLITDLAPIDLILQRMGRLHRHERGTDQSERKPKVRSARVVIAGVEFGDGAPKLEKAAARHIYGEYELLRSAAVLLPHLGASVTLPDAIAPLVQRAYGNSPVGPNDWQPTIDESRQRWSEKAQRRAEKADVHQIRPPARPGRTIIGWLSANVGDTDDESQGQGQVRDGAPSLEVALIEEYQGEWFTPSWLSDGDGGRRVPRDAAPSDGLAQIIASCALRLPLEFSNADAEQALWAATPEEWEFSPIYQLPVLVVDRAGNGMIGDRPIRYTRHRGLDSNPDADEHPCTAKTGSGE
ncbi:CRISPR-associated helicase Cas3' [Nocardia cyriacigeorgica]|uniref:CRISPR-associated helicase Cas3' n=1 Tax=Nocardia cyriacigeorgica TaxID=135487 RepID=UPI00245468AE|nr:CRISPR-associated helicase Cas3' [Nocardia cyriacigeorgica]